MSTRRAVAGRNLGASHRLPKHRASLDDEKSSLSNKRKSNNSDDEEEEEEENVSESDGNQHLNLNQDQHENDSASDQPEVAPVTWSRQQRMNNSIEAHRSTQAPSPPPSLRDIASTSTLRLFDLKNYSTVPLTEQIAELSSNAQTILGNMHCSVDQNVGGMALVDSTPPPHQLNPEPSQPPRLYTIHPENKYGLTPLRKKVSILPKMNDITSIFLLIVLAVFTSLCAVNTASTLIHEYNLYTTAPYIKYNQYVLNTHTIKDHGLGYINSLLHDGPTLRFSLPYVFKSFFKKMFNPPDLSNFISAQTYTAVEDKMAKHHVHHYTPRLTSTPSITKKPNNYNPLADVDSHRVDFSSPFYRGVAQDHAVCTDDNVDNPRLQHRKPQQAELYDRQYNHNAVPVSPYTASTHDNIHTHNPKQPSVVVNRPLDKISNWVLGWFDNRKFNREAVWETQHLTLVYSVLYQFIYSSLFATMAMIGIGVWKDVTAFAIVATFNSVFHRQQMDRSHHLVTELSILHRFNQSLNKLPVIPQAIARALSYFGAFAATWCLMSIVCMNPVVGFATTTIMSMIWFRFCADPAKFYESMVVAYPCGKDSNQEDIVAGPISSHSRMADRKNKHAVAEGDGSHKTKSAAIHHERHLNVDTTSTSSSSNNNKNRSKTANYDNKMSQLIGLCMITARHVLVISLCCVVIYSSVISFRNFFAEIAAAPAFNSQSPIEYSDYINSRLNLKFIGSQLFTWSKNLSNLFSTKVLSSKSTNLIPLLKTQAKANARDLISITQQTTRLTLDLITTFFSNLFTLTEHCLIVVFTPLVFLSQSTGQHLISPQDYPGYLLHFSYMVLCFSLALKIFFTARNAGYISSQFLSPFASNHEIRRREHRQRLIQHRQQNQNNPDLDAFERDHEMSHLSYDDGSTTSVVQLFTLFALSSIIYSTGGVIVPLSFYCIDEMIVMYKDFKRFQTRDVYAARTSLQAVH